MSALHIALSLVRVKKLFLALLFWPLLIGLGVAALQISFSRFYINVTTETPDEYKKRIADNDDDQILHGWIVGPAVPANPSICTWSPSGEVTPAGCQIAPFDVAVWGVPSAEELAKIQRFLKGATAKIHLCDGCKADVVFDLTGDEHFIRVDRPLAVVVPQYADTLFHKWISETYYLEGRKRIDDLKKLKGTTVLRFPGLEKPVNITEAARTMILVMNTAFLVIIALWLALKAHRRVLDYFAKNDALLPLVAACGKDPFYRALWVITLLRVGCFLLASVPATALIYVKSVPKETRRAFFGSLPDFSLWVMGIVACLALVTIVASVAELKQRAALYNFIFRYVPLICWVIGSVVWGTTLLWEFPFSRAIQNIMSATPLFGLSPVILYPLLRMNSNLLIVNALCSALFSSWLLKSNAKWFAAHLEEL